MSKSVFSWRNLKYRELKANIFCEHIENQVGVGPWCSKADDCEQATRKKFSSYIICIIIFDRISECYAG